MRGKDFIELVRGPAALTVLGDTLAGGARGVLPPLSSVCIYWAGMALNDYADRELDAVERPERPLPSGRVTPTQALGIAAGLTAAGVALATVSLGPRGARTAILLSATVWAYDLVLKQTAAGPAAMAAARGLDVLLGGGPRAGAVAGVVAVHTLGLTTLSRGEVDGGDRGSTAVALAATSTSALVASRLALGAPGGARSALGAALVSAYAVTVGGAQVRAAKDPSAATVRKAVGAGILGLLPLQGALVTACGRGGLGAALAALHPLAKRLAKRVSPT